MELEKTQVTNIDTWNDIEALERETKLLLESVRGKAKAKEKANDSTAQGQKKQKSKVSRKKLSQSTTLDLFPTSKYTVEVLDDASPDATPRDNNNNEEQLRKDKLKRVQLLKLEQTFRSLTFTEEARRIKGEKDIFVATADISLADVEREEERLQAIENNAKTTKLYFQEDASNRSKDLKKDRAALMLQCLYRGHLGRRKVTLLRYINRISVGEKASDWVQIQDKETGDHWFYNKVTQKSQWNKPYVLKSTSQLPEITPSKAMGQSTGIAKPKGQKIISVSMSLPDLRVAHKKQEKKILTQKLEAHKESAIQKEVEKELKISRLNQPESLLAPDGSFKPQLRAVVFDALLDTRFDNVSTVLADPRWFEKNDEQVANTEHKKSEITHNGIVLAKDDPNKTPLVSVLTFTSKKLAKKRSVVQIEGELNQIEEKNMSDVKPSSLTLNSIAHTGFQEAKQLEGPMCFGCWSAGFSRKCSLHDDGSRIKPSQTMLLCRNWDLDVMRRRYRSEEIQEIFLHQESSLRFDAKHKKFYTVVEQRHPIYRLCSQQLETINNRMAIFCKVKYWMLSIAEEFRQGNVGRNQEEQAKLMRIRRGLVQLSRIERFTALNRSLLPLPPITGYSWAERTGAIQHLFKHQDPASGQEIDLMISDPLPVPKQLYLPREYHVSLPKTFPLPRAGEKEKLIPDATSTLPVNCFVPDKHNGAWIERISSVTARESIEHALSQVKALTPVTPVEMQVRAKRPPPTTMKFATIGQKAVPGNMAVGGLPVEMLVYQLISTYFSPQYGSFMVMDKGSISPAVSPEVSIAFKSILMPPTLETFVERPLEHALTYRRVPTIGLNSNVSADDKYYYGLNRPEQTGEQDSHGFRTTTWAPKLLTFPETDPQAFVPGQTVASLNVPKPNVSFTTHADATYPFCEPSTRDNSTLDFYHLLLFSVISMSKAQVFTALTVQEPGQFQRSYRLDLPLGHLVVSVYRSWAYRQKDTIQEFKTDDGVSYWYHRKTGQTFWERPRQEDEETSPLQGGVILDAGHDEEPTMITKGEEGADRRYTQGEFRDIMLKHIEDKKEAINRRKAAAVTVRNARERGMIPDLIEQTSTANLPATSFELSQIDHLRPPSSVFPVSQPSSFIHAAPSADYAPMADQVIEGSATDLMQYYEPQTESRPATGLPRTHMVRGSNLDETSALMIQNNSYSQPTSAPQMQNNSFQANPMSAMMPPVLGGFDNSIINNLTQTIGQMFGAMMNMDRSNPQEMIQLGLGMGLALMQTGAVNNMVQNQINMDPFNQQSGIYSQQSASGSDGREQEQQLDVMPSIAEDAYDMQAPHSHIQSEASQISGMPRQTSMHSSHEPIGLPYPTAILSSDRALDHSEEMRQKMEREQQLNQPLNTMERARNLLVEQKPSDTPDAMPIKVAAEVLPTNAEQRVFDEKLVPLVAYPELSSRPANGAPATYETKPPAGLGVRFVSKEEAESQLKVPGADNLRRTVMPLPVGFFDAIEAKHVAKQAVDYLPQVPNFPQSRTIGRVKPRSAAADWLMISFDPWSAGKNPLSTEFVPSLMAKADKLLKEVDGRATDTMEQLRGTVLGTAFVNVQDEAGLAQQRADVSKAQVMAQDFQKLCSLCRHGKFSDAEQLINQPDWSVPIDFQDDQGNALLHVAAQNGSKRLVKLCLRRGASLNLQNLTGQTSLHFAFGYGYSDVGDYLVSKGADDSIRNKDGLTCYEGLGARELALL